MDHREIVERYFAAMRRGAEAEDDLMALFADDAVYVQPFAGTPQTARGRQAIRASLRAGWEQPLPDLKLIVNRIDVAGDQARSSWTCESPALPGPIHGTDTYTIRDGRITRLEVQLDE